MFWITVFISNIYGYGKTIKNQNYCKLCLRIKSQIVKLTEVISIYY